MKNKEDRQTGKAILRLFFWAEQDKKRINI